MFGYELQKGLLAALGERGSVTILQAEKKGRKEILVYCPGRDSGRYIQTNVNREEKRGS